MTRMRIESIGRSLACGPAARHQSTRVLGGEFALRQHRWQREDIAQPRGVALHAFVGLRRAESAWPLRSRYSERRKFSRSCSRFRGRLKLGSRRWPPSRRSCAPGSPRAGRWCARRAGRRCAGPGPTAARVRNSRRPASPWRTPSARPAPMSCTSRSENRLTGWLRSAATLELPVRQRRRVAQRAADVVRTTVLPARDRVARHRACRSTASAARGSA